MNASYEKYGFYTVNIEYVKHLHSKDSEVFYSEAEGYDKKPYLGLIANLGGFTYCIPLTSAKPKHLKWKNVNDDNYVVYEDVEESALRDNDVFRKIGEVKKADGKISIYKKILAVLEIKKMIPINESLYSYVDFNSVSDESYRILLQKEYQFLYPHRHDILEKERIIYKNQKESKIVKPFYCTFSMLESTFGEYISPEERNTCGSKIRTTLRRTNLSNYNR